MSCHNPITVDSAKINGIPTEQRTYGVPCGRCSYCKLRRKKDWTFRMLQEDKRSFNSAFVTLTYDTQYVPITSNGFMTLDNPNILKPEDQVIIKRGINKGKIKCRQDHITQFLKQFRALETRSHNYPEDFPKMKYYLCAEYGEEYARPHYHLVIFNLYDHRNLGKAWKYGQIHIGESVTGASIAYTAGYMDKLKRIPEHSKDYRRKEFSRMSRGIGDNYTTKQMKEWHKLDIVNNNYVSLGGGIKQAMPRYYYKKIYTDAEKKLIQSNAQEKTLEKEQEIRDNITQPHLQTEWDVQFNKIVYNEDKFYKNRKKRNNVRNNES